MRIKAGVGVVGAVLLGLASACTGGADDIGVVLTTAMPGVVQGGDSNVAWTVVGVGFEPGASVSFDAAGVTVTNVTVVSETQVTFNVTAIPGVAAGTPNLTITNVDASAGSVTVLTVPQTVGYATLIQPVFDASCVGCHGSIAPSAGLDLSSGSSYAALVGVSSTQVGSLQLVNPSMPDVSYLVDKIEGTQTVGQMMPPGGTLSLLQLQLIRGWIEAGAPNN